MDAATAAIVGTVAGGSIAVVGSLAAVALQIRYQKARDQAERLVALRRDFVAPLQHALSELIALAIRAIPERSREFSIDPDTWPKDWKMIREEQDELRDRINQLALMSPYSSTVDRARAVVQRLDEFANAQSNYEQIYLAPSDEDLKDWFSRASDEEKQDWLNSRDSSSQALDQTRKDLLDAVYTFRRHLELLVSRPEGDPDSVD